MEIASDGLVGLTPTAGDGEELLVEKLFEADVISLNAFSVEFKGLDETSYILLGGYNEDIVSSDDEFSWVDLADNYYWNLPFNGLKYGDDDISLESELFTLDTGTSLTYFEETNGDWDRLYSKISDGKDCGYSSDSGLRACT